MSVSNTWDADLAAARIRELQHLPGALLPILHALQEEFGYVDESAVPVVAEALNISHAEVSGTARAACSGWSPWSKWRSTASASAMGR